MRAPPPVSVRGNGGPTWRWVQVLLPALAVAAVTFWGLSLAQPTATATLNVALLATALGLATGLLVWRRLGQSTPQLAWGGQHWTLQTGLDDRSVVQGQLEVMVDLGSFMLLRLVPTAGPWFLTRRWTAITAREAGVHWHGLRAAAHARVVPQAADPDKARATAADLRPTEASR